MRNFISTVLPEPVGTCQWSIPTEAEVINDEAAYAERVRQEYPTFFATFIKKVAITLEFNDKHVDNFYF